MDQVNPPCRVITAKIRHLYRLPTPVAWSYSATRERREVRTFEVESGPYAVIQVGLLVIIRFCRRVDCYQLYLPFG